MGSVEGGGRRILFEVPPPLAARAQRRFRSALIFGLTVVALPLTLPLLFSGAANPPALLPVYVILAPLWSFGALLAFMAQRLLRRYNGLAVAEEGVYPPFHIQGTPRGRRSFILLEEVDRVSVEEQGSDFTAAVSLLSGKGVVMTSTELSRLYGRKMEEEFPKLLDALYQLQAKVAAYGGPFKGH